MRAEQQGLLGSWALDVTLQSDWWVWCLQGQAVPTTAARRGPSEPEGGCAVSPTPAAPPGLRPPGSEQEWARRRRVGPGKGAEQPVVRGSCCACGGFGEGSMCRAQPGRPAAFMRGRARVPSPRLASPLCTAAQPGCRGRGLTPGAQWPQRLRDAARVDSVTVD